MDFSLPRSLWPIAEVIGEGKTRELVLKWPVKRPVKGAPYCLIYFPKDLPRDHPLVDALGEADAKRLCDALGGSGVKSPTLRRASKPPKPVKEQAKVGYRGQALPPQMVEEIAKRRDAKESVKAIADALGINEKTVRRAIASKDLPRKVQYSEAERAAAMVLLASGLSTSKVAQKIGCCQSTVMYWRGANKVPDLICEAIEKRTT